MKKIRNALLALTLSGTLLVQTACMGSFALTLKVYEINNTITDNKFVNNFIFWIIAAPVYSFTTAVDVFLLNLIEFWTDSNPLAMADLPAGDDRWAMQHERVRIERGFNSMDVQFLESGVLVNEIHLTYDMISKTWFMEREGAEVPVFSEHQGKVKFFFGEQELVLSSQEVQLGIKGHVQQELIWAMR
ncbi:MAG: DUF3332 family protein [Bacteroidia bacterium]